MRHGNPARGAAATREFDVDADGAEVWQNAVETLEEGIERLRREHYPAQYRGGRARAGVHPGGPTRPDRLKLAWEVSLGGEITWGSALTGNGDTIAIGTRAGALCLLNAHTGGKVAQFPAGDEITAPASWHGDTLVYAGWDGIVRGVDWRSGGSQWSFRARADVVAAPTELAAKKTALDQWRAKAEKMGPEYDTPTLLGVYRNTSYLHHGKARSLMEGQPMAPKEYPQE